MEYALPALAAASALGLSSSRTSLTPLAAAALGGATYAAARRGVEEAFGTDFQSQRSTWESQDDSFNNPVYQGEPKRRRLGQPIGSKRLRGYTSEEPPAKIQKVNHISIMPSYRKPAFKARRGVKTFRKKKTAVSRPKAHAPIRISTAMSKPTGQRKLALKTVGAFTSAYDTTGTLTLLNGLTIGSNQVDDRIGKDVFMKSLTIQGELSNNTAALYNICRTIVFMDMETKGAAPAITDVLTTATSMSFYNSGNLHRFKILLDDVVTLQGVKGQPAAACFFHKTIPLGIPIWFNNGNAGTVADISKNSIYVLSISNIAAGTGAATSSLSSQLAYISQ